MADSKAAGCEVDDLDALLDEAMDIVDAQERQHEERVKARDAELDQKLQAALQDSSAGDSGDEVAWLGEMMRTVEELKTSLSDDMDESTFTSLKDKIDSLLHRVEASGIMNGDDKGDFASVKTLLDMLGNDPQQAEQLAQALASSKGDGDGDGDGDDTDNNGSHEAAQLRAALEQLKADPAHFADEARQMLAARAAAAEAAAATTVTTSDAARTGRTATDPTTGTSHDAGDAERGGGGGSDAASAGRVTGAVDEVNGVADAMKDNLAKMLLSTFRDPQFAEPVRVMRDAYGRWLAAHDATLSDEDKERYRKQHAMTIAICDFLAVPLTDTDDERMVQLMEMMHEFSQLGEPPADLTMFDQSTSAA